MKVNGLKTVIVGMLVSALTACGGSGNGGEIVYGGADSNHSEQVLADMTPLVLQREVAHFMTVDPEDNLHKYYYKSEDDQTVSLRLTLIEGPNRGRNSFLNASLETSTGRTISFPSVPHDNTGLLDIELSQDEILIVNVSSYGIFTESFYDYTLELLPETDKGLIQDDEFMEPNNTIATAYRLTSGKMVHSELQLGSTDQYDIYRVDLTAGINYTVSFTNKYGNGSSTVGGVRLEVTDKNKTPLVSKVDFQQNEAGHFVLTPTKTGQYYIHVYSPVNSVFNNDYFKYDLVLWPEHEQLGALVNHQTLEPNDSSPLAIPVNLGEQVTSELAQGPNDFIDHYKISLAAGGQYQLAVEAIDGPARSLLANLRVAVVSEDGARILMEEKLIKKGQTLYYTLVPVHDTTAIIRLYYNLTRGHEVDYHQYKLSIEQP